MVHPDKCQDPRAREAFEGQLLFFLIIMSTNIYMIVCWNIEIKKAHDIISNEDRRKIVIRTIENARNKTEKEYKLKLKKGVEWTEFMYIALTFLKIITL